MDVGWSLLVGTEDDYGNTEGIVAAEISVLDTVTGTYSVITNTPGITEQNPSLCLSNNLIAYDDDDSGVIGIPVLVRN